MADENKTLIFIPKDANYIEILGHRIDGFDSFEAFCEHLKKYTELEEAVNRQKAEIEKIKKDLKYYLDTNEENGVVYIPKFIIDNLLKSKENNNAE